MKQENCADKETIEYTHTTVPSSMRSPYWKYFGFPADSTNKILTRQKIICTICGTAITYNKNTSNLRTHLISRHPETLHQMHNHQRQRNLEFSSSCDMADAGDFNSAAIMNEMGKDECNSDKLHLHRESNKGDPNVSSLLKIRRLNTTNAQELNVELMASNGLVSRPQQNDYNHEHTVDFSAVEINCGSDYHSVTRDNKEIDKDMHEAITENETSYEFLTSETENDLKTDENIGINCSSDFNVGDMNPDAVALTEDEAVIIDNEISQKPMFVYCSDSLPCSIDLTKKSNVITHNELLVNMLVSDLLPLNVLQGMGFKQLLNTIGFVNVDKEPVESKILADYSKMKCALKKYIASNLLQQDKPYSFSIENFKNNEGTDIISVYVNFHIFDIEYKFESILLEEIVCSKSTDLIRSLQDFDLSRCAAIVTTNANNSIVKEFALANGIEIVPCVGSMLTRCISLIFQQDVVSELFQQIFEISENLNLSTVKLYCPWWKLKLLQDFLDSPLAADEKYKKMSSELGSFITYIKPLKITFDTINSEQMPFCTLVRPLVMQLFDEHFLKFNTNDNACLQSAQKIVSSELRSSIAGCSFFSEAVLFDPRFQQDFIQSSPQPTLPKQTDSFGSIHRTEVILSVYNRYPNLVKELNLKVKLEQNHIGASSQAVSKSCLRSFFQRISNTAGETNLQNINNTPSKQSQPKVAMDLELNRYKGEQTLDLELCPQVWWQTHSERYKFLHKIANYYLSVPCLTPRWLMSGQEEVEVINRSQWWQKSKSLQYLHAAEKCIWYLHYNRSIYNKMMAQSTKKQSA
ncbi:uncharacterized protein LOC120776423 isoform X2 [Bactrocera tryoni]|uniref:uncharacterized protein LOC120776423 isoform X2 n=1 Tax=Bactrocera tryoni TaxID=59916 RepID=UPI001A995FA4|nr:uncharacterized protein LOC120776423 isoform X2 [Bactrocera tryoni]